MSPLMTKRVAAPRRKKATSTAPMNGRACAWCRRAIWSKAADDASRYCSTACEARERHYAEVCRAEAAREQRQFERATLDAYRAREAERRKKPVATTGENAMWGAYAHW